MIFILIVIGLVIDLGGGPNHVRLGFKVCPNLMVWSLVYLILLPL